MKIIIQDEKQVAIETYNSSYVPQKDDVISLGNTLYLILERVCVLTSDSFDKSTPYDETWALRTVKI